MRREADSNGLLNSIVRHFAQRVGKEWMPVAHSNVGGDSELARYPVRLRLSNPRQRRTADQRISMLNLAYHIVRHRPAARNVLQKFRDVLYALRAAMGDQQHRLPAHDFLAEVADAANSCTNCARFFTLSTGVFGRMPWPRLKMW